METLSNKLHFQDFFEIVKMKFLVAATVLCIFAIVSASRVENLPEKQVTDSIVFRLHTRGNQIGMIMGNNANNIRNSHWSSIRDTKFIIHGHNHSPNTQQIINLRDAFLRRGDFNIVVVDWMSGAGGNLPANRVREVGVYIGNYINFLLQNGLTTLRRVSLIGHHIGAHVAGIAGKSIVGGRIQSIYGLDPPSAGFSIDLVNFWECD